MWRHFDIFYYNPFPVLLIQFETLSKDMIIIVDTYEEISVHELHSGDSIIELM